MIEYHPAPDVYEEMCDIVKRLEMHHVDVTRVACIRSHGSSSKYIIARCHALSRVMQTALNKPPHYVIEVVSENFDNLSPEEKTKTIIHELLHIPKTFAGGFRHHRPHVNKRTVESAYRKYKKTLSFRNSRQ